MRSPKKLISCDLCFYEIIKVNKDLELKYDGHRYNFCSEVCRQEWIKEEYNEYDYE